MLITTSKTEYTRKSDGKVVAISTGTGIRYSAQRRNDDGSDLGSG